MISYLLEPFAYDYMLRAIWVSALVGGTCAFLSAYLIMKGWSLMGDAMSHSVVPGVALAYYFNFSYVIGAFSTGILAALGMFFVRQKSKLKEDAIIGIIFTTFFAVGLLILSIKPLPINIESIILGNLLAISDEDVFQVSTICVLSIFVLALKWKDFMLIFFDEVHAGTVGLSTTQMKLIFFCLLSAATVSALQTVGAILVVAMVITPGATAYLLTDRFSKMILISTGIGVISCVAGTYSSYFLDGSTGGLIVLFQTLGFLGAFLFSPKYGYLK